LDIEKNFDRLIFNLLDRIPVVSFYGNTRGWKFILSWSHRIAGLVLVLYLLFHIYTLSLLSNPSLFTAKMAFYNNFFFKFLEWILAVPLIFHALNGARLISYLSSTARLLYDTRRSTGALTFLLVNYIHHKHSLLLLSLSKNLEYSKFLALETAKGKWDIFTGYVASTYGVYAYQLFCRP